MTRFTRAARRWFAVGVFLGTALSCGRVFAGDHSASKRSARGRSRHHGDCSGSGGVGPGLFRSGGAGSSHAVRLHSDLAGWGGLPFCPYQGAAATTAQAPVINIKLEVPSTPAMTATAPQSAIPTAQAASIACPAPSVAAAPQVAYAVPASPAYVVSNVLVSQQAVPMQLYAVSKARTGLFKHRPLFKSK